MENPWPQLPIDAPRVLPSDRSIIDAFNARYAKTKFAIQTQLLPEPFIGDPDARVYLLNLNPGYEPKEDDVYHADVAFRTAIIDNLNHKTVAVPLYFFDPRLKKAPGSKWWGKYSQMADRGCRDREARPQPVLCRAVSIPLRGVPTRAQGPVARWARALVGVWRPPRSRRDSDRSTDRRHAEVRRLVCADPRAPDIRQPVSSQVHTECLVLAQQSRTIRPTGCGVERGGMTTS